jgi:acetyl esterase/lipase
MARFALLLALVVPPAADPPEVVALWPGSPPGDVGLPRAERWLQLRVNGKAYEVAGRPTKWRTNVTVPTITVFRPEKEKNTGAAMIICPGGGYHNLGWDVEGEEVAAWLNARGMTGILLKYRCPRRPGDAPRDPPLGPLIDAQRAVSLVRSRAADWGIDPAKIGMVGFSAGGHLVGATATNFEKRAYEAVDAVDEASCRPDFAVMLYSGYFRTKEGGLSPTIRFAAQAPPMLLFHATDDKVSDAEHSVTMYTEMKRIGVPAELHVYGSGGHGWGVREVGHPCAGWTDRCLDWLRSRGVLR